MTYAILLAGGIGRRTGLNIPKQFFQIKNKPFLAYCIDKFVSISEFKKIVISSPKEYLYESQEILDKFFPNEDRFVLIEGGETRHETLTKSIECIDRIKDCENPVVIKHAAARIFVTTEMIRKCIEYTKQYGAAGPIIQSTDFMIEVKDNRVINIPPRPNIVHVQTPQGFHLQEYLEVSKDLTEKDLENVHDLISMYYLKNKSVYLFDGDKSNFKITTPLDVEMAKSFLL